MDLFQLRYGIFQHACAVVNAPNVSKELRSQAERVISSMFALYERTTESVDKAADKVNDSVKQQVSGIVVP